MEKLAYIIGVFIIIIMLLVSWAYFIHGYTLSNMKIKVVNEKENVIQVQSFGSTWIYEY